MWKHPAAGLFAPLMIVSHTLPHDTKPPASPPPAKSAPGVPGVAFRLKLRHLSNRLGSGGSASLGDKTSPWRPLTPTPAFCMRRDDCVSAAEGVQSTRDGTEIGNSR